VASFVGTPRVNLVAPEVLGLAAPGLEAGLRPEDLALAPPGGALDARVWLVEPMGAEAWVTLERAGAHLVARCGPEPGVAVGAAVGLAFDPARLHWFDRASGRRVAAPAGYSVARSIENR
jgi:multiple sugar transport system ATP-binding protein